MAGTYARFVTTEGNFTIRLFDQEAPKTVENFVGLAEGTKQWSIPPQSKGAEAVYNGTIFLRNRGSYPGGVISGRGSRAPVHFADDLHPKRAHKAARSRWQPGPEYHGGQYFIRWEPHHARRSALVFAKSRSR